MSGDKMNFEAGMDGMVAEELEMRALEARIVDELEHLPETSATIPVDFAKRVAAKIPARRSLRGRSTHYGRAVMGISLAVLFAMLVVLAGKGFEGSTTGLVIEWTLCVQFLAIAVWMGSRHRRSN
jgi:hypothetical protein